MSSKSIVLFSLFLFQCSPGRIEAESLDADLDANSSDANADSDSTESLDADLDANSSDADADSVSSVDSSTYLDTNTEPFDAQRPSEPVADENGGTGNITTYGSVTDPAPSSGGACNYGDTRILNFAAINVNVHQGDGLGQWNGGRVCGQCAEVAVRTAEGDKSTVVRIVDKCPDEYCGIDLGGLPAQKLMGAQPGRYAGRWQFVPCGDHPEVSDAPPSLFVKEGSNPWWAVVQVRNPPAAVRSIKWAAPSGLFGELAYATEAENYYAVPDELRTLEETVTLTIELDFDIVLTTEIVGIDLSVENSTYLI